ncbi:MAG: aryl-sulfate sulfotransferase [Myxococcota bacterium]
MRCLLSWLLPLSACAGCDASPDPATCTTTAVDAASVSASVDDAYPTFATVALTAGEPVEVRLYASAEGAPDVPGPTRGVEGDVTLPLRGLRPETAYTIHVVDETAGGCEVATTSLTTGAIEGDPSGFDVLEDDGTHEGFLAIATLTSGTGVAGVTVVDAGGAAVWHWQNPEGVGGVLHFSEPTPDGDAFRVLFDDPGYPENARVVTVDWTGETSERSIDGIHHSLTQKVPGVAYAAFVHVSREVPGFGARCGANDDWVVGDAIVEVGADGTVTEVWNAFDHWSIECHEGMYPVTGGTDWTHLNALDYDPDDDAWLVSSYWYGELVKIDRATGEDLWRLGTGPDADCVEQIERAHGSEFTDLGVAVYDNGHSGGARMVELEVDWATGACSVAGEIFGEAEATTLGDVDVTGGRWFTAWGDLGELKVAEDEAVLWHAKVTDEFAEEHGGFVVASVDWLPVLE